jgi:UDP-glucose 4-epimerase
MKVLFYGSRGWIGKQFVEYLNKNNVEYVEADERADNEKAVEKCIKTYHSKL